MAENVGGENQTERIQKQLNKFEYLARYKDKDRVVTWSEYLEEREKHFGKSISFSSGFFSFDNATDGFVTGELVTLSGYTAMGKTLFLQSLIRSFGVGNVPVVTFSYEDAVEKYLAKFKAEGAAYPIYVPMQLETGNLQWLEDRIVEAKMKFNARVVTIDHLHYLLDMNHGRENMSLKIGSIMRFLKKRIAEEHNLLVFIVAHQEKLREGTEEASINTIRDSSLIGQESDTVVIVQRLPDDPDQKKNQTFDHGYALVKVDKARRAGTFRKRLAFRKCGDWMVEA